MKTFAKVVVVTLVLAANALPSFASPVLGPLSGTARVNALASFYRSEVLRGGEATVVSIVGDGDTDLDIIVRDGFGRIVASATGPSDVELLRFVPAATGVYEIEIRNLGRVYNQFGLSVR